MATIGFPGIKGYYECDACKSIESRVLIDSWTGMDLCFECAQITCNFVTMSPDDEGDNLKGVLKMHGRMNHEVGK